jgi:hypothetical protein
MTRTAAGAIGCRPARASRASIEHPSMGSRCMPCIDRVGIRLHYPGMHRSMGIPFDSTGCMDARSIGAPIEWASMHLPPVHPWSRVARGVAALIGFGRFKMLRRAVLLTWQQLPTVTDPPVRPSSSLIRAAWRVAWPRCWTGIPAMPKRRGIFGCGPDPGRV